MKNNLVIRLFCSVEDTKSRPTPLILNAEGRTVDQSGKEVQLIQRMPTLKANIRAQKREQFIKFNQEKPAEEATEHKFYDSRVEAKAPVRTKRGLKFHDKGTFVKQANQMRMKVSIK